MVSLGRELSAQRSQQKQKISPLNTSKCKGTGMKVLDVSLFFFKFWTFQYGRWVQHFIVSLTFSNLSP